MIVKSYKQSSRVIEKLNELYEFNIILSSENIKVKNYQVINYLVNKI